jgi:RHS repeat-associated protein
MVRRIIGGSTFNLVYDAENRLTQVSGAATAAFGYNGDGERILGTENGVTMVYIGNYFEWNVNTSAMTKYYYAGTERVAMKVGTNYPTWLLGDHLGSTSVAANNDGSLLARQGYKAWGEQRFPTGASPLPTTFRYTGQREASSIGLYFYGARWYDAGLGRWTQPDNIIPLAIQGVQAFDRYAYVRNNPLKYVDTDGHCINLGLAALGAVVGLAADYSIQVYNNINNGMSLSAAATSINTAELLAAGAGGLVFGLTMGIGAAVLGTGYGATAVSGFFAGLVSGQVDAFTEAGINEAFGGGDIDVRDWINNANSMGFLDRESMIFDAGSGVISAVLGKVAGDVISSKISEILGQKISPGNVPEIKFYRGQMYIQMSGHPGLHLGQTQSEYLRLLIAQGSWKLLKEYLEEIARQIANQWFEEDTEQE